MSKFTSTSCASVRPIPAAREHRRHGGSPAPGLLALADCSTVSLPSPTFPRVLQSRQGDFGSNSLDPNVVEARCHAYFRREFEADATGARLLGDGRPLARALSKLEQAARVVPMDVDPAQSAKFIVNPLTGRHVNFASLFMTHPSTEERIRRLVSEQWAA